MLHILTSASLLALASAPAMAQSTEATMGPSVNTQATVQTGTTTPDASVQASPAPSAETRTVTVQKLVEAEFATYDANNNGNLESAEFSSWVLALYEASGDANAPKDAAAKATWSKAAFATADSDKNKLVTKAEMNIFLAG